MYDREKAHKLLEEYNKEPFHIIHGETVSAIMAYMADELGYGEEKQFWSTVGLLHDIDFENWPDEHCKKAPELLKEGGADERLIHAVVCHGYGLCTDVAPELEMEKVLFACDELTGLIGAVARMRPSKSTLDLEVSSVMKKFKTPKFAAGCSRDVIAQGAEMLGWSLEELMEKTIMGMRTMEQ